MTINQKIQSKQIDWISCDVVPPGPKNKEAIFNDFYQKHGIGKNRYHQIIHSSAYIASSSTV